MTTKIEARLKELRAEIEQLEAQSEAAKGRKTFKCVVCGEQHRIRDCTALQTHYYRNEPYDEHWAETELWILCPKRPDRANRILFMSDYKLPYEERGKPENNRDAKFRDMYKHLFQKVEKHFDGPAPEWHNNEYFDEHAEQFGLTKGETQENIRLRKKT